MGKTIGILIFDGAEEMDFVGPWEVMTAAVDGLPGERILTFSQWLAEEAEAAQFRNDYNPRIAVC